MYERFTILVEDTEEYGDEESLVTAGNGRSRSKWNTGQSSRLQ